ncbi:hypothetical protein POSPLADRAFT_1058891 [Postia placenta MAD-698-R-SB12]|uniref:Uncharacterized protein n=1 Tax=Postia placenta MAD-698-R-SB12 TaxID=670580 RepID=A0A1X6MWU9_9APHY|nr:hypothetical protein POSPLADRAFT_1058891 [Postia placenta MAD-698-R-SB12]OSX60720.1 hypothetical protein POSPLADRAFT_1058891 [Postia placenta MAD-698-R-SB12]
MVVIDSNPLAVPVNDAWRELLQTPAGIQDEDELKQRIVWAQADACYEVQRHLTSRIASSRQLTRRSTQTHLASSARSHIDNDVREAVVDGFPLHEFWELRHLFFKSTPDTSAVSFIPSDTFDEIFCKAAPPGYLSSEGLAPNLSTLTALTPPPPLRQVPVFRATSFFRLFDEEAQLRLARALAGVLRLYQGP